MLHLAWVIRPVSPICLCTKNEYEGVFPCRVDTNQPSPPGYMHRNTWPSFSAWIFPAGVSSPPHFRMSTRDGSCGQSGSTTQQCTLKLDIQCNSNSVSSNTHSACIEESYNSIQCWTNMFDQNSAIEESALSK